jgi:hemerythrin-like domain-containing protein
MSYEALHALTSLSRDHHHALRVAQRLRRADDATASAARADFLDFWVREGRRHFRIEEDVLLPGFARYGDAGDDRVVRVLVEHVDLRRRATDLEADAQPAIGELRTLGQRLNDHVRFEERVLFPLIEQAVPPSQLAELALELAREEGRP